MSRTARWLPRALFESLFIVLSILLALAVNEWRDKQARITRVAEARASFANEIRANRDLLLSDPILAHHRKLQAEYRKLNEDGSIEPGSVFDTGIHPAALRDAAWRSFSASGTLVDFAPADVILLSDIYRAQEDLEKLNSSYIAVMREPRADHQTPEYKRDLNRSLSMYFNDVVPMEEKLARQYESALEKLGGK
ncbi:MAG TPA: hypothetical protein VM940_11690 [Chthoniobacterales bacterium]|jgi:hypothetical protein|nr:hypothetical protein [Chthoniobacterales bacterium]